MDCSPHQFLQILNRNRLLNRSTRSLLNSSQSWIPCSHRTQLQEAPALNRMQVELLRSSSTTLLPSTWAWMAHPGISDPVLPPHICSDTPGLRICRPAAPPPRLSPDSSTPLQPPGVSPTWSDREWQPQLTRLRPLPRSPARYSTHPVLPLCPARIRQPSTDELPMNSPRAEEKGILRCSNSNKKFCSNSSSLSSRLAKITKHSGDSSSRPPRSRRSAHTSSECSRSAPA